MSEDGEQPPDGPLIGGRYRLVARIGSGPTGTVWRARDEAGTGEGAGEVAVKEPLLPGDPADDEESGRIAHRLYREARAAARVRHPSAVTYLDVVTEGGLPWIVMELVEGESLREAVRRGPLPPAEAARMGLAVLGALRAAHAVGIVHRDIKPANVLIESGTGRVVVTDFGIGDGGGHGYGHGHGQGYGQGYGDGGGHAGDASAGFVAPERRSGRGAGPASDLWSLGALLAAAVEGGDPGPLGPLLERLRAPEPEARPGAEEVAVVLEACAGVTSVPESEVEPRTESGSGSRSRPEPAVEPRPLPSTPPPAPAPALAPAPDPRRRTPLAALALLLAKKPGAE
ncbi:serine/threonine-protein kinase [Streptomyces sp. NPDC047085]|uniref:serine/threonine-protein kinase n=1 Tax=Streptomyces sp. NPDC047085 TaxID=3155140 RepID=UPI0033D00DEE